MTTTVTIEEAAANLEKLITGLAAGDEIVITKNQHVVAKLVSESNFLPSRPPPGLGKGSILYMAPDFDAPLEEFEDYQ
jgi:antitoxin (DNA-binding transcriptional repressor) of toxin-antitoxin stability system